MADPQKNTAASDPSNDNPVSATEHTSGMSLSMHDGVDASCDCCSCEAEPYWIEAMAKQPAPTDRQ